MSSWKEHFDIVSPSWMENWYDSLQDLTIRSSYFRLSQDEMNNIWNLVDGVGNVPDSLFNKSESCLNQLTGDKFFFRLGSRSPKDNQVQITKAREIGLCMCDSERVMSDLFLCEKVGYLPYMFFREWRDIKSNSEFRCFVKNRELKGICQYFYGQTIPELQNQDIRDLITRKTEKLLAKMLPMINLRDFVFDMVYEDVFDDPLLLEINPFSSWTDPCLFDWATEDWRKFQFKYVSDL